VNLQLIVIAAVAWPILFILVCLILYFVYDVNHYYLILGIHQIPTLSLSGSTNPSYIIFNYGLHLESILAALVFIAVYVSYQAKIIKFFQSELPTAEYRNDSYLITSSRILDIISCGKLVCATKKDKYELSHVLKWNKITLFCGLLASIFMSLVGSISPNLDEYVHSTFAFFMFFFGILHMALFYYHISRIIYSDLKEYIFHQCCLFCTVPVNLLFCAIIIVTYATCNSYECRSFVVNFMPSMEYWTILLILMYILQFYKDLDTVVLQVTTTQSSAVLIEEV